MANTTSGLQNITRVAPDNSTKQEDDFRNLKVVFKCIYFLILAVGLIGNGLVIFVTGFKMRTTVKSIWFLNLAITDFIFICVPILMLVFGPEPGDLLRMVVVYLMVQNMFSSIFFLTVISLDRCVCTWFFVWAQNNRTLVKARIICVIVWLLSVTCSVPAVSIGDEIIPLEYDDKIKGLVIYKFTVGFVIPFLIIAASYISIALRAKRLKRQKQLRPFRVIILVILAFFICWFPSHVYSFCSVSAKNWSDSAQKIILKARPFIYCLTFLNSCLNPILYVFMCDEYKIKLKQSLLLVLESAFTEKRLALRVSR